MVISSVIFHLNDWLIQPLQRRFCGGKCPIVLRGLIKIQMPLNYCAHTFTAMLLGKGQNGKKKKMSIIFPNAFIWNYTSIQVQLKFVPGGPVVETPGLVVLMSWNCETTRHYLNERRPFVASVCRWHRKKLTLLGHSGLFNERLRSSKLSFSKLLPVSRLEQG